MHGANAPAVAPSSLHWNVPPGSLLVKPNVAVPLEGFVGVPVIVAMGGVRSTANVYWTTFVFPLATVD